jgi:hypothetical protein
VIRNPQNGGSDTSIGNALGLGSVVFLFEFWKRDRVQRPAPAPQLSRVILTVACGTARRCSGFKFLAAGTEQSSRIGKTERRHRMGSLVNNRDRLLHGFPRFTGDIDLLIDPSLETEAKVFQGCLVNVPRFRCRGLLPAATRHSQSVGVKFREGNPIFGDFRDAIGEWFNFDSYPIKVIITDGEPFPPRVGFLSDDIG